jgi:hypothetical protein
LQQHATSISREEDIILMMKQHAPLKCWYLYTKLHSLTPQKTVIFIFIYCSSIFIISYMFK